MNSVDVMLWIDSCDVIKSGCDVKYNLYDVMYNAYDGIHMPPVRSYTVGEMSSTEIV